MTFRDQWANCKTCDRRYLFSVEMQRRISAGGEGQEMAYTCPSCYKGTAAPTTTVAAQPEMQLDPISGHWVGSVKWFDLGKGYGFIDRGDGTDIFFHKSEVSGLVADYVEGRSVTYDVEETVKGPQAIEVQLFTS